MEKAGFVLIVVGAIGASLWFSASVWSECRADHSVSYCLRLVSK